MLAVSEWDRRNIIEREGIRPSGSRSCRTGSRHRPTMARTFAPELGVPAGVR